MKTTAKPYLNWLKRGAKLIGVLLFVYIVWQIDRNALRTHLQNVYWPLLIFAFFFQYAIYAVKALRWHYLVHAVGLKPHWNDSWRLYHIGLFFGAVTPGKLGELSRVAYLSKLGLAAKVGLYLSIADRAADAVFIGVLALMGCGLLFGVQWTLVGFALIAFVGIAALLHVYQKRMARFGLQMAKLYFKKIRPHLLRDIAWTTLLSWTLYFVWAVIMARSIGIAVAIPTLVAAFTLTGLCSILPIAPSGLGTRDAALLTLLAPYGVTPEQAVALALLMFVSIMLSSGLGLLYCLYDKNLSGR